VRGDWHQTRATRGRMSAGWRRFAFHGGSLERATFMLRMLGRAVNWQNLRRFITLREVIPLHTSKRQKYASAS